MATWSGQCVFRRKLGMKGFLKIHPILQSSNGDFVYPAARKADRNNIFRKRKLSRKEVTTHILHAGGCCRERVCPVIKYGRNPHSFCVNWRSEGCSRGISRSKSRQICPRTTFCCCKGISHTDAKNHVCIFL